MTNLKKLRVSNSNIINHGIKKLVNLEELFMVYDFNEQEQVSEFPFPKLKKLVLQFDNSITNHSLQKLNLEILCLNFNNQYISDLNHPMGRQT